MIRRILAALLLLAAPAGAAGVSGVGISYEVDTASDYILIVGDPQIGALCQNIPYGWTPAGDYDGQEMQDCGQAQINETDEVIRDAFARYPINVAVIEGDLVDFGPSTDLSRTWHYDKLRTMFGSMPVEISERIRLVLGNHDTDTSTCNYLDYSLSIDWGLPTPGGRVDPYWSVGPGELGLRRTRVVGWTNGLTGQYDTASCHAQNFADRVPSSQAGGVYSFPQCWGDDSVDLNPGGSTSLFNNVNCTADSDCRSNNCGVWQDDYSEVMNHVKLQFDDFNQTYDETVLITNTHQPLCRWSIGLENCDTLQTSNNHFNMIQDLYQCVGGTDDGKYCSLNGTNRSCGGGGTCTQVREGYESRTNHKGWIEGILPNKQGYVHGSGHVGATNPASTAVQFGDFPVPYLKAETVGAYAVETDSIGGAAIWPIAAVVEVPHNGPPRVVEYLKGTNYAPVFTTTALTVDSTGTVMFRAEDANYGQMEYYVQDPTGTEFDGGCLSLNQVGSNGVASVVGIWGQLQATSCPVGTMDPVTICASDNLNATSDGTDAPGFEDCSDVTITIE